MTDNHPITPPPELVQQLQAAATIGAITIAYQAGADAELEACINYFHKYDTSWGEDSELIEGLRAARRPKPPSLKEQALAALNEAVYMADDSPPEGISTDQADVIRRALEQLDD